MQSCEQLLSLKHPVRLCLNSWPTHRNVEIINVRVFKPLRENNLLCSNHQHNALDVSRSHMTYEMEAEAQWNNYWKCYYFLILKRGRRQNQLSAVFGTFPLIAFGNVNELSEVGAVIVQPWTLSLQEARTFLAARSCHSSTALPSSWYFWYKTKPESCNPSLNVILINLSFQLSL